MSTSSLLKTVVFRWRREINRVIWGMFSCYNCSELFRLLYVLRNLVYFWLQTDMILIHHAMHIYATPFMYLVSKDCNPSLSERARLSLTLLHSECFPSLWVIYLLPVSANPGTGEEGSFSLPSLVCNWKAKSIASPFAPLFTCPPLWLHQPPMHPLLPSTPAHANHERPWRPRAARVVALFLVPAIDSWLLLSFPFNLR